MAVHNRIQNLRKEHEALLHFVDRIEEMLGLAAKSDFAARLKGLTGLRSLEHGLAGVVEHCRAEDRIIESTYRHSLQPEELMRIDAEHQQILRAVTDFREELKFATADRTLAMVPLGLDLINRLRAHIAYEREMLGRIAELENPPKVAVGREKTGKRARRTQRRRIAKRKIEAKATRVLPYTLEPHPEL